MKRFAQIILAMIPLVSMAQDGGMELAHWNDSIRYNIIKLQKDHYAGKLMNTNHEESARRLNDSIQRVAYHYASSPPAWRNDLAPWRVSLAGGYGVRIAPAPHDLPDELASYRDGLRSGYSLGADLARFINPNMGLGMKYNLFRTQNRGGNLPHNMDDATRYVSRSDNIYVHYVGPSAALRTIVRKDKVYTNFEFSMGYTFYYNDQVLDGNQYSVRGNNFGFVSTIGADFVINRGVSLGVNMNIMAASVDNLRAKGREITPGNDEVENLSRISLGVVMRYYR